MEQKKCFSHPTRDALPGQTRCKDCQESANARNAEYIQKKKSTGICISCKEQSVDGKLRCQACLDRVKAYTIAYRYKLSPDDLNNKLKEQGGKCAICKCELTNPRVDHNHSCCPEQQKSCGKCVRGLLCDGCNVMLAQAKDNPQTLRLGADYLEKYR